MEQTKVKIVFIFQRYLGGFITKERQIGGIIFDMHRVDVDHKVLKVDYVNIYRHWEFINRTTNGEAKFGLPGAHHGRGSLIKCWRQ